MKDPVPKLVELWVNGTLVTHRLASDVKEQAMKYLDLVAQDLETMEADTVRWHEEVRHVLMFSLEEIQTDALEMADALDKASTAIAESPYDDATLATDVAGQLAAAVSRLSETLRDMYACTGFARSPVQDALVATVDALSKELDALREDLADKREGWEQAADTESKAYEAQVCADYDSDRGC
ncbi:MAG: hypothetical protein V3U60_16160 [Gammaproteobacteria bacterium]